MAERTKNADEGFLSRWSRLKRADDADGTAVPAATPPAPEEHVTREDTPPPEELPDIETLDNDSDYTVFLRENVPEMLRNAALRKLWRSDPVLANLDGLNDYDEDFAAAFKLSGAAIKTAFKPGPAEQKPASAPDERPAAEARQAAAAAATSETADDAEVAQPTSEGDDPDAET